MTHDRIQRFFLWTFALLALVVAVALVAVVALGIPRNASGMAAKSVCSAAFVAGRPWQGLMDADGR